jgi:signal transduction histidine kinase
LLRVVGAGPGGFAEVEILDSGRPRTGTSGTGLGLLGMRERVASLGGSLEIGPRATGGFRVRVRLPLARAMSPDERPADTVDEVRAPEPAEWAR